MPLLRRIPPKYRLPLLHRALEGVARWRSRGWRDGPTAPGPLVVTGFLHESSGVGQGGRLSLAAFQAAGLDPIAHDITPCYRDSLRASGRFPTEAAGGVWFVHANAQESLLALMAFPPETWARRYRITYWAWETSRASPLWAWAAQFFHEIWVPSRFVRDAVIAAGDPAILGPKLRVMPHPLPDLSAVSADRPAFGLSDGFEALALFDARSMPTRKNPWAAIEAWKRAFPEPRPGVWLRLKTQRLAEAGPAQARLAAITARRPDVTVVDASFDAAAILQFIASFDAIVSLHRSEGFGLTLAEAMATGVTPVATDWSGNVDFMTTDNAYLVPYRLIAVEDPLGLYGGAFGRRDPRQLWADPDLDAAAAVLRRLVDDPDRASKKQRARVAAAALRAPWRADALARLPLWQWLQAPAAIAA